MNIVIKNVTDSPVNDGLLLELARAGCVEGKLINDVSFSPGNNACYWSVNGFDCVAYLNETCIELKKPVRISEIHIYSLCDGSFEITAHLNGKLTGPKKLSKNDLMFLSDKTDKKALARKYLLNFNNF